MKSETRGVKGQRVNSRSFAFAICRSSSSLGEPWMIQARNRKTLIPPRRRHCYSASTFHSSPRTSVLEVPFLRCCSSKPVPHRCGVA